MFVRNKEKRNKHLKEKETRTFERKKERKTFERMKQKRKKNA